MYVIYIYIYVCVRVCVCALSMGEDVGWMTVRSAVCKWVFSVPLIDYPQKTFSLPSPGLPHVAAKTAERILRKRSARQLLDRPSQLEEADAF